MANPLDQFEKIDLPTLKNLKKQKERYANAPNYQEQQFASQDADKIRKEAGIESGSQGLLNISQLDNLIKTREASALKEQNNQKQVDLRTDLSNAKKQRKINSLMSVFQDVKAAEEANRAKLDPMFRKATGEVRTDDTMQRKLLEKSSAIGATGQGQLTQSNIAQNVIVGGQMSNLREQRNQMENDINQRIANAQALRDRGVADAEVEASIEQAQQQLAQMESQAAAELKAQELQSQRDFDVYKINLNAENDATLKVLDNDLKQDNIKLEAEIKNAMDNNEFERARVLAEQKAQNDIKLQAIRQSGAMAQIGARNQASKEQIALRDQASKEQILLRYQLGGSDTIGGQQSQELPLNTIKTSISNALDRKIQEATDNQSVSERSLGESALTQGQQKDIVLNEIVENSDWFGQDANKLRETLALYGISAQELADYEDFRESALQSKPFN